MGKIVFVHIPKSAGTSFRRMLCDMFGDEKVSPPFNASHLDERQADDLKRFDVVSGHISIDDVDRHFPAARIITIVRDPVSRCLSWYHYARQRGAIDHPDVVAAQTRSVDEFFSLDPTIVYRNIYNRHVRQLGGHVLKPDADMQDCYVRAVETIGRCEWVGRFECLRDDIGSLADVLSCKREVALPSENVTSPYRKADEISAELRSKILSYNDFDSRLYEFVLDRKRLG